MLNDEFFDKLMNSIEDRNRKTIEEANTKQTETIKQHIEQEINKIKIKFEDELNKKCVEFQNKYTELKSSYEKLEKELRKNNIIIFGIENPANNLAQYIVDVINQHLELNLTTNDINNVYTIGKQKNKRPIIVKLVSYLKKQEILINSRKLKGTNIVIAEELTIEERKEQKILRQHLKKARSKKLNAYIKNKKLVVNDEEFTAQMLAAEEEDTDIEENIDQEVEIKEIESDSAGIRRNNSAPPTPILNYTEAVKENKEVFEVDEENDSKKRKLGNVDILPKKVVVRSTRLNSAKDKGNMQ